MLHTHTPSTVDCSLHPAAPAALSLVPHPLWVSVQVTRRVSSPIQSGLVCCLPSPGMSASVRWCWSGAWPSLLEVRRPTVAGQPYYKEVRPGAARGNDVHALCAQCSLHIQWITKNKRIQCSQPTQTEIDCIIHIPCIYCSQACLGGCAGYLRNSLQNSNIIAKLSTHMTAVNKRKSSLYLNAMGAFRTSLIKWK